MFSSQCNTNELFSRNLGRNISSESHSESRDSQFAYSQVEFESQMPDVNSQQFSTQSSDSPCKRIYGKLGSRVMSKMRMEPQTMRFNNSLNMNSANFQQYRAKAKERDERDHLLAAVACVRECASEVKSTVTDLRSSLVQDTRCTQDTLAAYLENLHAQFEKYNQEMLSVFSDREDLKENVAVLQKQIAEKNVRIEKLEETVQEYKEQKNRVLVDELHRSLREHGEGTKQQIAEAYLVQENVFLKHNETVEKQLQQCISLTKEGIGGVLQECSVNFCDLTNKLQSEFENQSESHKTSLSNLKQELESHLTRNQHSQREDVKALLMQQIQILDMQNDKTAQLLVDLMKVQVAELHKISEDQIVTNIEQNVNIAVCKQKEEVKDFLYDIFEAERKQQSHKEQIIPRDFMANSRYHNFESELHEHDRRKSFNGGSYSFLQHSDQDVGGSNRRRGSLRRCHSEVYSDTECFTNNRRPLQIQNYEFTRARAAQQRNDDIYYAQQQKEKPPRSRSQSELDCVLSQRNSTRKNGGGHRESAYSDIWLNEDNQTEQRKERLNEWSQFSNPGNDSEKRLSTSQMSSQKAPAITNNFLSPLLRNRNVTARQLFSKLNPSPSPVAKVLPQVQLRAPPLAKTSINQERVQKTENSVVSAVGSETNAANNLRSSNRTFGKLSASVKETHNGGEIAVETTTKDMNESNSGNNSRPSRKRKAGRRRKAVKPKKQKKGKSGESESHDHTEVENRANSTLVADDEEDSQDEDEIQLISNKFETVQSANSVNQNKAGDNRDSRKRICQKDEKSDDIYEFSEDASSKIDALPVKYSSTCYKRQEPVPDLPLQPSERLWEAMKHGTRSTQENSRHVVFNSPQPSSAYDSQDETDLSSVGSSPSFTVADVVVLKKAGRFQNTLPNTNRATNADRDLNNQREFRNKSPVRTAQAT